MGIPKLERALNSNYKRGRRKKINFSLEIVNYIQNNYLAYSLYS